MVCIYQDITIAAQTESLQMKVDWYNMAILISLQINWF